VEHSPKNISVQNSNISQILGSQTDQRKKEKKQKLVFGRE
jgi:hypothetical protein